MIVVHPISGGNVAVSTTHRRDHRPQT